MGVVAIINSIVSGVVVTLVAATLQGDIVVSAVAGIVAGAMVLVVLALYLARSWRAAIRTIGVRFAPDRGFAESHPLSSADEAGRPDTPLI